jgi:hypothetical protein
MTVGLTTLSKVDSGNIWPVLGLVNQNPRNKLQKYLADEVTILLLLLMARMMNARVKNFLKWPMFQINDRLLFQLPKPLLPLSYGSFICLIHGSKDFVTIP